MEAHYVIGLDFGTDSVRALLVDATDGRELGSAVRHYPRWRRGLYCDPLRAQFRQHPLDYIEAMEGSIREILDGTPPAVAARIAGLAVATTGSTPAAVDRAGTPLALLPEFADNPNAMFILWKDHTAIAEAQEINQLARQWETDYTRYSGGTYSSEWFWSKILHVLRTDDQVSRRAHSWVEHCDWIPALLCGVDASATIVRSRCAAGHKAMWHAEFGGLPPDTFWSTLDARLAGLSGRLYQQTYTSDRAVGTLSAEWAGRLGLPRNVVVGVGAIDAHMGAVGAGIVPNTLVKVTGTSTCDMLMVPTGTLGGLAVGGICGQVDGSIAPGMLGMEAGQSAFGDLYQWFIDLLRYGSDTQDDDSGARSQQLFARLNADAARLPLGAADELAVDWINGRRTPDANPLLSGWLTGLRLGTDAPRIFKALVEATAFGSRAIIDRFVEEGVAINDVIATGGISKKSPYTMQVLASVLNRQIRVARSEQTCALGAAMYAAVVSGVYPDVATAQARMGAGFEHTYDPDPASVAIYERRYQRYLALGRFQEANML